MKKRKNLEVITNAGYTKTRKRFGNNLRVYEKDKMRLLYNPFIDEVVSYYIVEAKEDDIDHVAVRGTN